MPPLPSSRQDPVRRFTIDELKNSISFRHERVLVGSSGERLLSHALNELQAAEPPRARRPRKADNDLRVRTLSTLLANLIATSRNRHSPDAFLSVPFDAAWYAGTGLSLKAMQLARETFWVEGGAVEGAPGVNKRTYGGDGKLFGREGFRTRWRATPLLLSWISQAGIDLSAHPKDEACGIGWSGSRDLIVGGGAVELADVRASRKIVAETNALIEAANIELPDAIWASVRQRAKTAAVSERRKNEDSAESGDTTKIALYRKFGKTWDEGGRLYGGFWQNLPRHARPHLTINGVPTVELDYGRLHPTLLYRAAGLELDFDPYLPGGFDLTLRDTGKKVFNALVNSRKPMSAAGTRRAITYKGSLDVAEFETFFVALVRMHRAITPVFGSGYGTRLQRLDSDILVEVLKRMNGHGAVALPIHDSLIVAEPWAGVLRLAMVDAYNDVVGPPPPEIKSTGASPLVPTL